MSESNRPVTYELHTTLDGVEIRRVEVIGQFADRAEARQFMIDTTAARHVRDGEFSGHRVVLTFDDGLYLKLICPETGCEPASTCGECHRHVDDEERSPCAACPRQGDGCWVKGWFDNCTYDELLHGEITAAIEAEWDGDHIIVEIVGPTPAVAGEVRDAS
jgi:hypothetical protein